MTTASKTPLVSVIIPVYNLEEYLEECLESVAAQTYRNLEVLVIDDASTDGTYGIAQKAAAADDRITAFKQQKNGGAGAVRNFGMTKATGDYLLFFDGDDVMLPTMVEKLVDRALETGAQVTSCKSITFEHATGEDLPNNNGPYLEDFDAVYSGEQLGKDLIKSFIGWPWDKLFEASFVQESKLLYPEISSSEDASFVFTALALAQRIALVDEPLACHRLRAASNEADHHLEPHNVLLAYQDLMRLFTEHGIADDRLLAAKNWGLSQTRWAFGRFAGHADAQAEVMKDYLSLLDDTDLSDDELLFPHERIVREMLQYSKETDMHQAALSQAFKAGDLQQERDHLLKLLDQANKRIQASESYATERITYLEQLVAQNYDEIGNLHQRLAELEGSTMLRVGQVVTAAPRMLKDAADRVRH